MAASRAGGGKKYGVKCITYNFMPVFDWTRTQLDKKAKDGSTSLVMYMDQLKNLDPLKDDIRLPGWDSSYTKNEVRNLIMAYSELGEEGLWKSLKKFLKKVILLKKIILKKIILKTIMVLVYGKLEKL